MPLLRVLLLFYVSLAHGQYPARPVNLVVPFTAGSDADLAARNLAQHAPRYLGGQAIVVRNQPGASGAIGTHRSGALRPTATRSSWRASPRTPSFRPPSARPRTGGATSRSSRFSTSIPMSAPCGVKRNTIR